MPRPQIIVRSLVGKVLPVRLDPDDYVDSILAAVEELEGIPRDMQRLVFEGHELFPGSHVNEYKIKEGALINMIARTRSRDEEEDERREAVGRDLSMAKRPVFIPRYLPPDEGEEAVKINVRMLGGKTLVFQPEVNATVYDLKVMIAESEDVPPLRQRLIYNGKLLADEMTLPELGVVDGAKLQLDVPNWRAYKTVSYVEE